MIIDLSIIALSVIFAYLLRFNFDFYQVLVRDVQVGILIYLGIGMLMILITQMYAGIIRYTSLQDGWRIIYTMVMVMCLVLAINYFWNARYSYSVIPYSVIVITALSSIFFLFFYRLLVKSFFSYYFYRRDNKKNVLIFGAGSSGRTTKQIIDNDPSARMLVVGFLEDDRSKVGKTYNGIRIHNASRDMARLVSDYNVHELIIAVTKLPIERKNELVDEALRLNIKIREVPPVDQWVHGGFSVRQIKNVKIEDLLGREAIRLDNPRLRKELKGKVVLITGAAGSIGSELVMQLIKYLPEKIVMVDQSESGIYQLEHELEFHSMDVNLVYHIGDINNMERMRSIFIRHRPQIIYHAAAYKHVPLMEENPVEAITCNVLGTRILADIAAEFGVEKFVFISTDKAVNPTNVMGASKRIAEMYIQSLFDHNKEKETQGTAYITTRFGNVLGSNGSVIPLFKKQIEQGGPITVTHPEITRYFMTISEAAELVLEAGVMGRGGEIFVFDMGKSIKIIDLARKMIRLSGFEPDRDVKIYITGLRDGEKLYEELLNDKENTMPTYHEKILIGNVRKFQYHEVIGGIDGLTTALKFTDENKLVEAMKKMVPEFISNASRFAVLDKKMVG